MGIAALPVIVQGLATANAFGEASMAEDQGKLEAQMADVAALQRETDRKSELVRAIGSQRARAGASGITIEGSPLSVINETIRQESVDTARDKFNTNITKQSALFRSKLKSGSIRARSGISLLGSGSDFMQNAPLKED